MEQAEIYFDKLSVSIDIDDQNQWSDEIIDAENQRFQTPAAMDIMGTRHVTAKKDIISTSSELHGGSPAEAWILIALSAEEKQCVLYFL